MKGSFFKSLYILYIIIVFFSVLISFFIIPIFIEDETIGYSSYDSNYEVSLFGFVWPTPGYTKINSPFGKRNSPTSRGIKLSCRY